MKGTRNLSKKSAIPECTPRENQRRIKKRTRLSAESIEKLLCLRNFVLCFGCFICITEDEMCIIDPWQCLRK